MQLYNQLLLCSYPSLLCVPLYTSKIKLPVVQICTPGHEKSTHSIVLMVLNAGYVNILKLVITHVLFLFLPYSLQDKQRFRECLCPIPHTIKISNIVIVFDTRLESLGYLINREIVQLYLRRYSQVSVLSQHCYCLWFTACLRVSTFIFRCT